MNQSELILRPNGAIYHLDLVPEELCDVILTVGDPERVERVSQHFDEIHFRRTHRELITHKGRIGNKHLMVLSTGMGTDNIEIVINELDALANVDFDSRTIKSSHRRLNIIRLGTSGSISEEVPVGTLLASATGMGMDTLMEYYDFQPNASEARIAEAFKAHIAFRFHPYMANADAHLLKHFGGEFQYGNTLTCPGFYLPQGRIVRAQPRDEAYFQKMVSFNHEDYKLTNLEMETAAYYALGRVFGHSVLSLNAILANRITGEFSGSPESLERALITKALALVENL